MTDYISREAALIVVKTWNGNSDRSARLKLMVDDLKMTPAADVRPVVRGEWLLDSDPGEPWRYRCSECGEITKDTCMGKPRANFCPWCGADMREEANHETTDR